MSSAVPVTEAINEVNINADGAFVKGQLIVPAAAEGVVIFAHGSGSSRHSPRNKFVARTIREAGIGTLLLDLLTEDEERVDLRTRELRFDIPFLAHRLSAAAQFVLNLPETHGLRIGFFGASTGAGAALVAAAELGDTVAAVVSRGGRPDLAGPFLAQVTAPTLLLVGEHDYTVIDLNRQAYARLRCNKELKLIPGATHLFEERGALEQVAGFAADWFKLHLAKPA